MGVYRRLVVEIAGQGDHYERSNRKKASLNFQVEGKGVRRFSVWWEKASAKEEEAEAAGRHTKGGEGRPVWDSVLNSLHQTEC
jgi:hypothetical protein